MGGVDREFLFRGEGNGLILALSHLGVEPFADPCFGGPIRHSTWGRL